MVDSKYTQYAQDVIDGKITANELVRLACVRYMSWFDRDDIYFDEAKRKMSEKKKGSIPWNKGKKKVWNETNQKYDWISI